MHVGFFGCRGIGLLTVAVVCIGCGAFGSSLCLRTIVLVAGLGIPRHTVSFWSCIVEFDQLYGVVWCGGVKEFELVKLGDLRFI